jgi:hypothetical protein
MRVKEKGNLAAIVAVRALKLEQALCAYERGQRLNPALAGALLLSAVCPREKRKCGMAIGNALGLAQCDITAAQSLNDGRQRNPLHTPSPPPFHPQCSRLSTTKRE